MIETRGNELHSSIPPLVSTNLHSKIMVILRDKAMDDQVAVITLTAVRIFAAYNAREVVEALITEHTLPADEVISTR